MLCNNQKKVYFCEKIYFPLYMHKKLLVLIILYISITSCWKNDNSVLPKQQVLDYKTLKRTKGLSIDSLYQQTSSQTDDSIKVNDLITIFRLSIKNKPIRNEILDEALQIAKSINYETGIANSLNRQGVNARYQHEYLKSTKLHKKAIEHYEKSWDISSYVKNLNSLGVSYRKMNLEEEALKYYYQALELSENLEDTKSMAMALNGIGNVFINIEKYKDAKKYFKLALTLEKINKNSKGMGYDYSNLGEVYMFEKKYDSSYIYHKKSLKIADKLGYKDNVAIINNTIGIMFQHKGDYAKSLEYLNKALPVLKEFRSKRYLSNALINMGINQIYLKQHDKGENNILKGLAIAESISSKENMILAYKALYDLYAHNNRYKKALSAYEMMTIYKDSMFNSHSENYIAALKVKHEIEKKNQQIQHLKLETTVQKNNIFYQFFAIALLALLGVFFFYYNRLRLKNKNLEIIEMRNSIEKHLGQILKLETEDCEENKVDITHRLEEYGLSPREMEVLKYIAQGMKNQEIADKMFVSLSTVKTHTKNIFEKLDVRNRIEAARKAQGL